MLLLILILLVLLILIKPGPSESFVSDETINNIVKNKDILNPNNSVNKIKKTICSKKNCIDVVDHFKLTKMYNNNPNSLTFNNIYNKLN